MNALAGTVRCVLACLALHAGVAWGQAVPPARLLVVTEISYPPFLFQGDDGRPRGILVDKWALWSAETGVPVEVRGMEWKKAQDSVLAGSADVVEALSYTEARTRLYEYSRPYAPVEAKIYFHRSIAGISDVASLRGFRVGAKAGSACASWLEQRGIEGILSYPASEALVAAAGAGEVRLFCMDAPAAQYFLLKLNLAHEFRQTPPLYATQFHWAVAKGRGALRDFIQEGYDRIPAAKIEDINARWIGRPVGFPVSARTLYYLAFAGLAVALAAALLALWNRLLRRRIAAATGELLLVANSVPVMIAHWGRDLRCRWANARYAAYYGLTPEAIAGRRMEELVGAEHLATIRPQFARVLAGESLHYESSPPGAGGMQRTFAVDLVPERAADGTVHGWFVVMSDLTGLRSADAKLRESQRRFEAMFHESPAPMALIDGRTRRYLDVNRAWLELLGYQRSQVLDHTSLEFGLFAATSDRDALYRRRQDGDDIDGYEAHLRRADGTHLVCLLSGRTLEIGGPVILRSVVNVTAERAAQREIQQLNASLEGTVASRTEELSRANAELKEALADLRTSQDALLQSEKLAALGRLVAGIAHELNTPIGNSLLSATTLAERTEDFARDAGAGELRRSTLDSYVSHAREAAQILFGNLDKAAHLIQSFKQVAADQTSSQRRAFALKEVVEEVLLAHHPMLKRSPITVATDVPGTIRLDSYPGPLGQVLGNLITNAVLHAYEGRPRGAVTVSARLDGDDSVEIAVRDDGCGISESDLKRVFEPFFTTRMGRGGTGLGLSICHRIVTESLGGTIRAASRLGEGTVFMVRVPLVLPATSEKAAA